MLWRLGLHLDAVGRWFLAPFLDDMIVVVDFVILVRRPTKCLKTGLAILEIIVDNPKII